MRIINSSYCLRLLQPSIWK